MAWQLAQGALVHSIWVAQLPLLKSELEVAQQAMLFLILSICHVHWTGPNWFELATTTKVDADVMYQIPELESPIVLRNTQIPFV